MNIFFDKLYSNSGHQVYTWYRPPDDPPKIIDYSVREINARLLAYLKERFPSVKGAGYAIQMTDYTGRVFDSVRAAEYGEVISSDGAFLFVDIEDETAFQLYIGQIINI